MVGSPLRMKLANTEVMISAAAAMTGRWRPRPADGLLRVLAGGVVLAIG